MGSARVAGGAGVARLFEAVQPQAALISVGGDNKFGHPSSEVLARLEGMLVYRTDRDGDD